MSVSPYGLLRLISAGVIGATTLAVALGRGTPPSGRYLAPPRHAALAGGACTLDSTKPQLLDLETGRPAGWAFPGHERLQLASSSPWEDGRGRRHFIGRGEGPGGDSACDLVRYEYPSGRLLDRLPLASAPASPPCWTPGLGAEVIFSGCDGQLYLADFEPGPAAYAPSIRRLRWPAGRPDAGRLFLAHPCRADACGTGRLLATLGLKPLAGRVADPEVRLCWLGLDPAGPGIAGAGPLIVPTAPWIRESCPAVAARTDGSAVVAFLVASGRSGLADLYAAPLRVDSDTRAPRVDLAEVRRLARDCRCWPPAFTPDGRAVYILTGDPGRLRIVRVPVAI